MNGFPPKSEKIGNAADVATRGEAHTASVKVPRKELNQKGARIVEMKKEGSPFFTLGDIELPY